MGSIVQLAAIKEVSHIVLSTKNEKDNTPVTPRIHFHS